MTIVLFLFSWLGKKRKKKYKFFFFFYIIPRLIDIEYLRQKGLHALAGGTRHTAEKRAGSIFDL
jgi:hypothetical protein